jgi:vancomycin resistance protein YoaR
VVLVGVPVLVVAIATAAWGIDTVTGGDVVRNVELAGHDLGGQQGDEVAASVQSYADELLATPVQLVGPTGTLESTVGDLGLTLDVPATAARAREAGRGFALFRPFQWAASFVAPHEVEPVVHVDHDATYHAIIALEADARIAPVEPAMELRDGQLALVPSQPGSGIDTDSVAARLPAAALEGDSPIVMTVQPVALPPATDDATIQAVVDEGNLITDVPLRVTVADASTEVDPGDQRAWLHLSDTLPPTLVLDEQAAVDDLASRLPELGAPPVDASVTLGDDGVPVVIPGESGTGCCEPGSGDALLAAMRDGGGRVTLAATERPPELTTEEVEAWGIREPVGGNRAWRSGSEADEGAPPGFTTHHNCCESRVTNIHRIADLVRGAVIPPGGQFSVNDHVGRRTRENGFVEAGAIRNGEHVSEVGGGVSQFATTLFNAAYFAGLDILDYQAHSEYFSRYPRGREATMGYPAPDLRIENTTPFGILIWTSYTDTSLTVTMYSSPFVLAEHTGTSEGSSGNCRVVTTERTRTYPDGSQEIDHFTATYRPGAGRFC